MKTVKKILLVSATLIMTGIAAGGGCSWSALATMRGIMNHRFTDTDLSYKTFRWCTNGLPFTDRIRQLLGGKYAILLQNNNELRPSGGFAGTYAVVETDSKGIANIRVQDIYEPDGKLPGHVDPPYPIQEAFGQGWWKLRDANWDPDFASTAATTRWFFQHGEEEGIDGIAAVNLSLVKSLIGIWGPVKMVTYDETVTDKNFYNLAQTYAETRTEGNMTDKRGFLGALGVALEERIKTMDIAKSVKTAKLVWNQLRNGEITLWSGDGDIQAEIERRRWGGRLTDNRLPGSDYLYVVESNLGANKANCCISRSLKYEINSSGSSSGTKITINWTNNNEFANPKPPLFWGGNYIDYVRVIIPKDKELEKVKVKGKELRPATKEDFPGPNALRQGLSEDIYTVESRDKLQIIGFWAVAEAQTDLSADVEIENKTKYNSLFIKHQPGSGTTNYQVMVDGEVAARGAMDRDTTINTGL